MVNFTVLCVRLCCVVCTPFEQWTFNSFTEGLVVDRWSLTWSWHTQELAFCCWTGVAEIDELTKLLQRLQPGQIYNEIEEARRKGQSLPFTLGWGMVFYGFLCVSKFLRVASGGSKNSEKLKYPREHQAIGTFLVLRTHLLEEQNQTFYCNC